MSIEIASCGNTHVGRVRQTNQDSYLCDGKRNLFIVADGMGGHAGGEVASSLAVSNIRSYLDAHLTSDKLSDKGSTGALSVLGDSINHACVKIYERALEEPSLKGMGTTATVMRIHNNTLLCGHVGDSRLYLIRCGFLYQITTDHSFVSEQIRAGIITRQEAEKHHLRNVITRSVGYQEQEDVDTYSLELCDGDTILMCSDGLHGKVNEETIVNYCQKYGILAVDHLIAEANRNGGDDNISVIICQVKV